MKTNYDKETGVKTWLLDRWYQKTVYVFGHICFWYAVICAIVAIIAFIINL